ncbi:MAG: acyl-ACP desaturase [Elusimicrobia bacterium]|nr:acyl-ACP desaturase [Elusimicrobiota bacterium]
MSEIFDLKGFIEKSKPLDLSGIDWSLARQQPVSAAERRILPYFIDVESYTIAYLRALLNTSAIEDVEIADFLSIWAYEESYHGRAIERFLDEAGAGLDPNRARSVQRPRRRLEALQDGAASAVSRLVGPDFVAVHMTWGAIQELTTLNGYRRLAEQTQNEVFAEIVRRIMRDESRHFAFYYHKAEERLARSAKARAVTKFLVNHFWKPVGAGIMPDAEVDFVSLYMFGGERGAVEVAHIDRTISRLPGMAGFDGMSRFVADAEKRRGPEVQHGTRPRRSPALQAG